MKKTLNNIRFFNINPLRFITHLAVYSALIAVFSCAQPASPQGGPRDKEPPTVTKTYPPNQSLNFSGQEVRFIFSEAIKPPQFDKEIFVSPFIKRPKVIRSDNAKRISIKFQEDLLPKTTYVITLTGIKDNHESNEIEEAYTLAFSTGDVLDSMEMKGKIISPVIGKGVEGMTVMLFDGDSIKNNDLKDKRPAYITKSDDQGNFEFKYLRNTPYKVFGVADQDQSNTYSQDNETIALSEDSVVVFPDDSTQLATTRLYSFLPDNEAPRLRNFAWWNSNTVAIRFDENLKLDSLNLIMTDTLNQDSVELKDYSWYGGTDFELVIHTSRPQTEFSHLHLRYIADSLNNQSDSVLRIIPTRRKTLETPLLKKPILDLEKEAWTFFSHRRFELADTALISLTDTARQDTNRKIFPLEYSSDGMEVNVKPRGKLKAGLPYVLRVKGPFFQIFDSTSVDTVYNYSVKWFNPEDYGNLAGSVIYDSVYQGPIVMYLLDKNKKIVRTAYDTTFSFNLLPADSYTAKVILDEDGNGVWTPGSLFPPKLPEKIFIDQQEIAIRANWEFEGHKVQINTKAVMKTKSESDTEKDQTSNGKSTNQGGSRPGGTRN